METFVEKVEWKQSEKIMEGKNINRTWNNIRRLKGDKSDEKGKAMLFSGHWKNSLSW